MVLFITIFRIFPSFPPIPVLDGAFIYLKGLALFLFLLIVSHNDVLNVGAHSIIHDIALLISILGVIHGVIIHSIICNSFDGDHIILLIK